MKMAIVADTFAQFVDDIVDSDIFSDAGCDGNYINRLYLKKLLCTPIQANKTTSIIYYNL